MTGALWRCRTQNELHYFLESGAAYSKLSSTNLASSGHRPLLQFFFVDTPPTQEDSHSDIKSAPSTNMPMPSTILLLAPKSNLSPDTRITNAHPSSAIR